MNKNDDETRMQSLEQRVSELERELALLKSQRRTDANPRESTTQAASLQLTHLLSELGSEWPTASKKSASDTLAHFWIHFKDTEAEAALSRNRKLSEKISLCWHGGSSHREPQWTFDQSRWLYYLLLLLSRAANVPVAESKETPPPETSAK